VVAPVLAASLATTAVVFVFVRELVDPKAAWWCALLFAFEPFNVVNSTTMTNDVILACLTFAAMTVFLIGDRSSESRRSIWLFAAAGGLMLGAFLVKITFLPVLLVMGGYSLVAVGRQGAAALRRHAPFYATLALGLGAICIAYYFLKGDLFWQFKAETFYYQTYKPDWYVKGDIDYPFLMWQYPRSLFGVTGYPGFAYREHGFLFWWVLPASAVVMAGKGNGILKLLVALAVTVFGFFEFYPQYLSPRYLPLVRQERYLEMLVPAAVIVAGTTLFWLYRRHRVLGLAILCFLLADFVVQASRRSAQYDDSQQDVRELAKFAASTVAAAGSCIAADRPAQQALSFYMRGSTVPVEQIAVRGHRDIQRCYVAVGGSRSFWWSREEVLDIPSADVPPHWVLAYQVPARLAPWRPTNLRVYYAKEPPADWYELFDSLAAGPPAGVVPGVTETAHPDGFDGRAILVGSGMDIPDLDNTSRLPAPLMQWSGWMRAEEGVYTFETNSDDGSWIYLNDRLVLDNGGTHPAKIARRTVRLRQGWYAFRLRYEDTGGDRLLRLRLARNHLQVPLNAGSVLFSVPVGGPGLPADVVRPRRPDRVK
jgi:hypothetical protein